MAKKIRVEEVVVKEKANNQSIIGLIIAVVILVACIALGNIFVKNKTDNTNDNNSYKEEKQEPKKDIEHIVTCSSTKRTFAGFPYQTEFLYVGNNFTKYTYSFFLDKGKKLDEDLLNNYVDYYADKMVWEVTEKGWTLDDYSNPYKYRIFYSTTPKIYCDKLGGCDEIQLEFSHVNEMLKDYEEQLELKCTIK